MKKKQLETLLSAYVKKHNILGVVVYGCTPGFMRRFNYSIYNFKEGSTQIRYFKQRIHNYVSGYGSKRRTVYRDDLDESHGIKFVSADKFMECRSIKILKIAQSLRTLNV